MTTNLIDLQNSDVIMIHVEHGPRNHPGGLSQVGDEGQGARGQRSIHVEPALQRATSAAADIHMAAALGHQHSRFFGGLMNYAMQKNLYLQGLRRPTTRTRSFLPRPGVSRTRPISTVCSTGYDGSKKSYDRSSWKYQLDGEGQPQA